MTFFWIALGALLVVLLVAISKSKQRKRTAKAQWRWALEEQPRPTGLLAQDWEYDSDIQLGIENYFLLQEEVIMAHRQMDQLADQATVYLHNLIDRYVKVVCEERATPKSDLLWGKQKPKVVTKELTGYVRSARDHWTPDIHVAWYAECSACIRVETDDGSIHDVHVSPGNPIRIAHQMQPLVWGTYDEFEHEWRLAQDAYVVYEEKMARFQAFIKDELSALFAPYMGKIVRLESVKVEHVAKKPPSEEHPYGENSREDYDAKWVRLAIGALMSLQWYLDGSGGFGFLIRNIEGGEFGFYRPTKRTVFTEVTDAPWLDNQVVLTLED